MDRGEFSVIAETTRSYVFTKKPIMQVFVVNISGLLSFRHVEMFWHTKEKLRNTKRS